MRKLKSNFDIRKLKSVQTSSKQRPFETATIRILDNTKVKEQKKRSQGSDWQPVQSTY